MAISTYAELKTAISGYAERGSGTDYFSNIDNFIDLAEAGFNRDLRTQQMEEEATVSTNSSGIGSLPADFLVPRAMYLTASPSTPLKFISARAIKEMNPYGVGGTAEFAAITGSTVIVAPVKEADFTLQYFEKIPALDDSNTTNWLLTLAPDAYLFACLAQGEAFNHDFQKAATYGAQAKAILADLGLMDMQARYFAGTHKIAGVTP